MACSRVTFTFALPLSFYLENEFRVNTNPRSLVAQEVKFLWRRLIFSASLSQLLPFQKINYISSHAPSTKWQMAVHFRIWGSYVNKILHNDPINSQRDADFYALYLMVMLYMFRASLAHHQEFKETVFAARCRIQLFLIL